MSEKIKICSKCKRELPANYEYFHKGITKDGFKYECKECRGGKFGIFRKINRQSKLWTEDDINYLKNNYSSNLNKNLSQVLNKTESQISSMSIYLNLYKDTWWSESDINILKEEYPQCESAEIFVSNFMQNRTIASVRKKASELDIKLTNIEEIRKNNLKGYMELGVLNLNYIGNKSLISTCRNRLGNWINGIKLKYDNKCYLTGLDNDLIIHHVKSFRDIFNTVLNKYEKIYNFEIKDMDWYYENNQEKIVNKFINEVVASHKLEDGVLISSRLHSLFHSEKLYGTKNCNSSDFNNFIERYYGGEFDNKLEDNFKSYNAIKRLNYDLKQIV